MINTKFSRIPFLWCFFVEDCWSCDKRNWLIHVLLLLVLFWNWHYFELCPNILYEYVKLRRWDVLLYQWEDFTGKGETWGNDISAYYLTFDRSIYWMEFRSCHWVKCFPMLLFCTASILQRHKGFFVCFVLF